MKIKSKVLLISSVGVIALSACLIHNTMNRTTTSLVPDSNTSAISNTLTTITPITMENVRAHHSYKYKLVLSGRLPNAAVDTTYTVYTDDKHLTFEQVAKSQLSSDSKDHLDIEVSYN